MRILVLGGTSFVGRAIVADLLAAGHHPTLFTRGRTGSELFPTVERRRGDRASGDYAALEPDGWDTVVDVSGYIPRHVAQAAEAIADRTGRYLFISTGSVYDHTQAPADAMAEDAPRLEPERVTEQVTDQTYGPLKVACEDEVTGRFADRATIVRPGVVAGRYDPTDRFTWWVRRTARGGRIALPGRPEQPVQVVDSGDLARLVTALLTADRPGVFNAVGPAEATTLEQLAHTCAAAAGTQVEVVAVDSSSATQGFPLVLPDPSWDVMFRRSAAAARAAGMTSTPLAKTASEVLAWDRQRGEPPLSVGTTAQQEAALLAAAG